MWMHGTRLTKWSNSTLSEFSDQVCCISLSYDQWSENAMTVKRAWSANLDHSSWFDQNLNSAPNIVELENDDQNSILQKIRMSDHGRNGDFIFRTISLRKLVQRYENIPRLINSTKIQMLRKQEVDGSYLSIKWAGAASSSLHSSHWSFPARAVIISSGYDQYYRYDLFTLFDYHLFLIFIG